MRKVHRTFRGFRGLGRVLFVTALLCVSRSVSAIGWGPTDFLIFGAPNFPDRIGVFDQNFGFKGYLFTGWTGLQAMNFDQQGRLVVFNTFAQEVRVYDSTGALVGGFNSTTSPLLTSAGDIQVMSDGNYILGTSANGARVFTPQGAFVRQYGDGNSGSIAVLPGNRLWSGNSGTLTMNVFDTASGVQIGSFTLDQQTRPTYMNFCLTTRTVLCIERDRDAGGVFERDLNGALLREFHIPIAQTTCNGATRGPGGDVFGTSNDLFVDIVRWLPDGTVAGTLDLYSSTTVPTRLLWADAVPEPGPIVVLIVGIPLLNVTRPPRCARYVRV
jgi:hypothetical protein